MGVGSWLCVGSTWSGPSWLTVVARVPGGSLAAWYPFGLTRHGRGQRRRLEMRGDGELRPAAKARSSKDAGEQPLLSFGAAREFASSGQERARAGDRAATCG